VPCGPINSLDEVFADAQVRSRGMRVTMPHARAGSVALVANPIRFSATPVEYRQAPPELGEHTDAILKRVLDLDDSQIARLRSSQII
jgi:crotonobetainyl-CoA:carnitine CoA-transferase CaiB-like acyl-CoA transferase